MRSLGPLPRGELRTSVGGCSPLIVAAPLLAYGGFLPSLRAVLGRSPSRLALNIEFSLLLLGYLRGHGFARHFSGSRTSSSPSIGTTSRATARPG